ncbi:hypothetical protein [Chitinophaga skermanii]|uniref:hypothetical protein n=1 Tax=Chitinophaga skermanii TaxID=331697 RepID=UPI0013141DE3|nr:hypothetical protein [Chitinophaga skermanii]
MYYLLTSSEFDTEVSLAKAVYANLGLIIHGGAIFFFNLKPGYVNKEEDEIKEIGQSL